MAKDKPLKATIKVKGIDIAVTSNGQNDNDYIFLTDMLKAKDGEFAIIKTQAGLNSYKISVKEWVEKINAIGLETMKPGNIMLTGGDDK
ncbi:MAG: hypothetical protein PHG06_20145 [Parabacteroides sp.]|nr:hypothetical protein [Parabacteroides sp.]